MALTKQDTKKLVIAVVKALEPKFEKIDLQFEQVDNRFEKMSIEFTDLIEPLATKQELITLNERMDSLEESFHDFTADMAAFESKVVTAFSHVDEQFTEQKKLIVGITKHIGKHSETLRNHGRRLVILEKASIT